MLKAATRAETPGIGTTFISFLIAVEMNLAPGSEIDGVPASETNFVRYGHSSKQVLF